MLLCLSVMLLLLPCLSQHLLKDCSCTHATVGYLIGEIWAVQCLQFHYAYSLILYIQAVKELIDLLEDNDIEHSETELVINEEEGTNSTNSTIEGLSEVFVSSLKL